MPSFSLYCVCIIIVCFVIYLEKEAQSETVVDRDTICDGSNVCACGVGFYDGNYERNKVLKIQF